MNFQVKVASIVAEATDIKSFEMVSVDGRPLPGFTAGSHIDVQLSPTLIRQYSLCNDPRERERYVVAVKKELKSRGGSLLMHELQPGEVVTISEPRNNFHMTAAAEHTLLMAGGIGVTPLLAMARQLAGDGASFHLHYFARSKEHAAFRDVLNNGPFKGSASFHYETDPAKVNTATREILSSRPEGAHLYLCGPLPFMDCVRKEAQAAWPADTVHLEYFSVDEELLTRQRERFQIRLANSSTVYEVPEDKTIVEVLAEQGIFIETSCEQGICGTCVTRVLAGTPDHRDMYLTDEEKKACDRMMPCVSRALSPLLILEP